MEDESISMVNCAPSLARGLNLLLVDNNTRSLMHLSSLLKQYAFKVTATDELSVAMSMICNHESQFRIVMIKLNMLGIDALSFLDLLHEKNIPAIFISSGGFQEVIWKALAKGSCYFLEDPILFNDLKYVWQHAYHSKPKPPNEVQFSNKARGANEERKIDNNDNESSKHREKRAELMSALMNFDSCNHIVKETEERREQKIGSSEKNRFLWTPQLHLKFVEAVAFLGGHKTARPKAILNIMDVPDLTTRQISSHMQKYKFHLKHNQMTNINGSPSASTSSNMSGETMFLSQLGSPTYPQQGGHLHALINQSTAEFAPGLPASTPPLNGSPKQDLFVMNYAETTQLDIYNVQRALENSSVAYEFPTGLASQFLGGATVGNSLPCASLTVQNRPETEYGRILKILEEDYDANNSGHGVKPDHVEQYSNMLRTIL